MDTYYYIVRGPKWTTEGHYEKVEPQKWGIVLNERTTFYQTNMNHLGQYLSYLQTVLMLIKEYDDPQSQMLPSDPGELKQHSSQNHHLEQDHSKLLKEQIWYSGEA